MLQRNLLLVDDDSKFLETLSRVLATDYKVFCASSYHEADQILDTTQMNLVILDYNLGSETGHDFIDRMRARNLDVPVIVISGCLSLEMSLGFLKRRVIDFLEKPVSLSDMKSAIIRALAIDEKVEMGMAVNYATRKVSFDGEAVNLTPTEFALLKVFLKNQGQHLGREELIQSVWGSRQVSKNALDTHLVNLKRKLPVFANKLVLVYGSGYCYEH